MGRQGLPHLGQDLFSGDVLLPLVGQWDGAPQLAVDAVAVAWFQQDGVDPW